MDIMNSRLSQKLRNGPDISIKVDWMNNDATNFSTNKRDVGFEFSFRHMELRSPKRYSIILNIRPKIILDSKKDTIRLSLTLM